MVRKLTSKTVCVTKLIARYFSPYLKGFPDDLESLNE